MSYEVNQAELDIILNSKLLTHNSFNMPEDKEPIEVIATFTEAGIFPRVIKWGKNRYRIAKVNLVHTVKEGAVRIYFFSVSDGTNAFKLGFNTETLSWWVEDSYSEA